MSTRIAELAAFETHLTGDSFEFRVTPPIPHPTLPEAYQTIRVIRLHDFGVMPPCTWVEGVNDKTIPPKLVEWHCLVLPSEALRQLGYEMGTTRLDLLPWESKDGWI